MLVYTVVGWTGMSITIPFIDAATCFQCREFQFMHKAVYKYVWGVHVFRVGHAQGINVLYFQGPHRRLALL